MNQINTLKAEHVDFIPAKLEEGILYVSAKYQTASHLCCCGCNRKVVTPLKPGGWQLTEKNGRPTLKPSIGNWGFPCQSHYWLRNGKVEWAGKFSQKEINAARERDRRSLEDYYNGGQRRETWWQRVKRIILSKLPWQN